ncbi:MAG: hypothetical protein ACLGH7_04820, partial [Actinomycetes bacterium]
GSFYNNVRGGSIQMPWEAILGFLDVLGLMLAAVWFTSRQQRRLAAAGKPPGLEPGREQDLPKHPAGQRTAGEHTAGQKGRHGRFRTH